MIKKNSLFVFSVVILSFGFFSATQKVEAQLGGCNPLTYGTQINQVDCNPTASCVATTRCAFTTGVPGGPYRCELDRTTSYKTVTTTCNGSNQVVSSETACGAPVTTFCNAYITQTGCYSSADCPHPPSTSCDTTCDLTSGTPGTCVQVDPLCSTSGGGGFYCGDGSCTAGETNANCASDCPTVPPPPDFVITVDPTQRSITQGGSTSYIVTVNPVSTYVGKVSLAAACPSNATCQITANAHPTPGEPGTVDLSYGAQTATLIIFNTASISIGNFLIDVTGLGGGNTHHVYPQLKVVPGAPGYLNATIGSGCPARNISLQWGAGQGANSYRLYRNTVNAMPATPYKVVGNVTSDTDYPAVGLTYYYWIESSHSPSGNYSTARSSEAVFLNACPLPVNNASCSSITPSKTTVIAGEVFSATVTMQNNGTTVWSPNDMRNDVAGVNNYHVTVSPWAATWNYGRAAVSTNVAPGESFTFTVPLTAPATAGTYNLSTQMIQEGVQWFGALCNAGNITVSAVPAPTVTMTAPSEVQLNNPFIVSWTSTNAVSVIPGSSIVPPAGCTMSPAGALALNDSRTVTCTTVGSKYFQIAVMNGAGTQAIDGKAVNITAPAALTPPTNLSLSCSGGFVNASWNYTNGWSTYYLRANPNADDWTWPAAIQENTGVGSSHSFPAVVGQTYHVWVHTRNPADGSWSAAVNNNVFCPNTTTTGTLSPANPSCVIASGASSCTVNLSWSTTNPVGTSAITAVGMANVNGNSGTNVAFTVPYSSRIFYLYNNAVLLATSNATASCTGGTAWNGTVCAPTGGGGTSSIIGRVCKDDNGNGVCDGGELYIRDVSIAPCTIASSPQSGFSINYSGPENGAVLVNECSPTTGYPRYSKNSLTSGTYSVSLIPPVGWVTTGCIQSAGGAFSNCALVGTGSVAVAVGGIENVTFTVRPPVAVDYSVTVNKTVGGTVTSTDGLISCGGTCSRQYTEGSTVTLQATPLSVQWRFAGWSGACTGTGNCVLTVDGNKSVTASFKPRSLLYQEF